MKQRLLCFVMVFSCIMTFNVKAQTKSDVPSSLRDPRVMSQQADAPRAVTTNMQWQKYAFSNQRVLQLPASPRRDANNGQTMLYGNVIYNSTWKSYSDYADVPFGIYSFSPNDVNNISSCFIQPYLQGVAGTIYAGKYYLVMPESDGQNYTGATILTFDISTWKQVGSKSVQLGSLGWQLTTDVTTDNIYGIFYNDEATGYVLGTMDPTTMEVTAIGETEYYYTLAADNDGTLYAINQDNELVKLDKKTAKPTVIGSTGINISWSLQSGTIDPQSGIFYWAACTEDQGHVLLSVNKATGKASKIDTFNNDEEIAGLAIPAQSAELSAPARPNNLSLDFNKASLSGKFSFTAPDKTYGGSELTGSLKATVLVDGEVVKTLDVTAGKQASVDITVPSDGLHSVAVYASNAAGNGPQASTSYYFGVDVPGQVLEPTLVNNDETAELTWDAPETSLHGGYMDPSTFNYTVIRNEGGKQTVVATGLTDTEFSEKLNIEGVMFITYTVVSYSNNNEGASVTSNKEKFGKYFTAPVTWMLDDEDEFDLFTIIDANNDGNTWHKGTWGASKSYTQNHTIYAETGWNDDDVTGEDDWFITPNVKFDAKRLYYFNFSVANTMSEMTETFEIKMGQGTTVADMNKTVASARSIAPSDAWYKIHEPFSVDKAGVYNIGIHAMSTPRYFKMYVDSISVTEGPFYDAPDSVSQLKLHRAYKGQLNATLTFNAPAKTVGGDKLADISKIEIYRQNFTDTVLAATLNAKPGEKITWNDNKPANGFNTYIISAYNSVGQGVENSVTEFIGIDRPTTVDTVRYYVEGDKAILSWDPVDTIGANGGYVDPSKVTYSVFDGISYKYYDRAVEGTSFVLPFNPWEGAQKRKFYGITPSNDTGRGRIVFTDWFLIGEPYAVPFNEEFNNGRVNNPYWFNGENNMVGAYFRIGVDQNGNGMLAFMPSGAGGMRAMYPGYIDLRGTSNPVLKFDYNKAKNCTDADSIVICVSPDGNTERFTRIEVANEFSDGGMKTYAVDLTPYKDCRGLIIAFYGYGSATGKYQYIDNIRVMENYDYNLTMVDVDAQGEVKYNKTAAVNATVANYGSYDMENFTVNLYRNGRDLVASVDGGTLAAGASATYNLQYEASISDPDTVSLHVEIVCDDDELPDDDASELFNIIVKKPLIPVVDNLNGQATEQGISLSWTVPSDINGTPARKITDDFENYADFATSGYGDWNVIDGDGKFTYSIANVEFPHMYGPAAFIIFNPSVAGVSIQSESNLSPHSGNKYAMAFSPQGDKANDWLISPELSGDEQTISFYVKNLSAQFVESFDVYYSTISNKLLGLIKVDSFKGTETWSEVTVDLPKGAKYFAINYVSNDGNAILIDDVSYIEAEHPLEVTFIGYNVYKDGVKINSTPITDTSYSDLASQDGLYWVTAVYKENSLTGEGAVVESKPSNSLAFGVTGVNEVNVDDRGEGQPYDLQGRKLRSTHYRGIYIKNGNKYLKK